MTIVKPLYGHNSRETAYLVEDYPYGRLRCKIWFWIEYNGPKKGYRYCSQTENPKTGRLNAPKYGTYHLVGANMYLDENNHVTYAPLGVYDSAEKVLDFLKSFPETESLQTIMTWCRMKYSYCETSIELRRTPYKVLSDRDIEELTAEMQIWEKCFRFKE